MGKEELRSHVKGCKACSVAILRAVFAMRPLVDASAGAAMLDEMCDDGKRAAVSAPPPAPTPTKPEEPR